MPIKYDLKKSKDILGPLYPRLLDKSGREIDGFHRESASGDWPTKTLDQIDTDVKYWAARIVANSHRRSVSKEERKESIIELAKALRDEGHEGSLVNTISELTTFSKSYISGLLPIEFKEESMVREIAPLSRATEQTTKRKPRKATSDKEKLDNLYKNVVKSAFSGQGATSQKIEKAKEFGLDVTNYDKELEGIKITLQNSIGKRHDEVKDSLNDAYEKSVEMKKILTDKIDFETERVKKANEELRIEVKEEVKQEVMEIAKKEHTEKPPEKTAHVGQSTGLYEWYTPENIIEATRKLMNTIDVDPASSDIANQIVKATTYYTIEDDGLKQEWSGNVWMNPPYSQPLVTQFCDLLVEKYVLGEVKQACVLVNNATETGFYQNMMKYCQAICFIKGRVKFVDEAGKSGGAPLQGQTILYFGDNVEEFGFIFSALGVVLYAR